MKKQLRVMVNDSNIDNAVAFIKELQEANLISDNGIIEYDTDDAIATQKLDLILSKYGK